MSEKRFQYLTAYQITAVLRKIDQREFSIGNIVITNKMKAFCRIAEIILDEQVIQGIDGEYTTSFPSGIGVKLDIGIYVDLADLIFVLDHDQSLQDCFANDTREKAPEHPIMGVAD